METNQERSIESHNFFTPTLWRQRRELILDKLQENNVTTVGDIGCGEGALLSCLVSCNDEIFIEKIVGLDKSIDALNQCWENCKPWPSDFENLRERPLEFKILNGSCDLVYKSLMDLDALIMSEIIEHLDPAPLDTFPKIVFGVYKPKLLIISTPNAEFNVLFPNLNYLQPNQTFRDDDHRFEWTRSEFQEWSNKQAQKYNYSVEFTGVGTSVQSLEQDLGFCTQFAIFFRNDLELNVSFSEFVPENVIKNDQFPCFNGPYDDQLLLNRILILSHYEVNNESQPNLFKIRSFWSCIIIRQQCKTLKGFLEFLSNSSRNQGYFKLIDEESFELLKEFKVSDNDSDSTYE